MKHLTFLFGLIILAGMLISSSGGVTVQQQKDRTGSPVSDNPCSQCHGGGSFTGNVDISLSLDGSVIDKYIPGQTYELKILMNHDGASRFGFQSVIMDAGSVSVGTYGTPAFGTRVANLNGRSYFEQSQSLSSNEVTIDWTAPAIGTGDVSIFTSGLLANGNFGTSGDVLISGTLMLQEDPNSAVLNITSGEQIKIFPSHTADVLKLKGGNIDEIENVYIYDMSGKRHATELEGREINVRDLGIGLHLLQVQNRNGQSETIKFTKI